MQNLDDQYRNDSATISTLIIDQDQYPDQGNLVCPSFRTYASATTVDNAEKVSREFKTLNYYDDDNGFEFVSFQTFDDNDNVKIFPVFDRDLVINDGSSSSSANSSDVAEDDQLEGVPAGSYCVWVPKTTPATSPSHCKKSNSTGSSTSSSRKWRLRDLLLRRSNSEGGNHKNNDAFVLLTPAVTSPPTSRLLNNNNNNNNNNNKEGNYVSVKKEKEKEKEKEKKKKKRVEGLSMAQAHEAFYVNNNKSKENYYKRQSYLPYRRDLVGFFANVNAMGKAFSTF